MADKSILITGCSSGIGYTCALGLKDRGWRVFATARRDEDLRLLAEEGLEPLHLDYCEPGSVAACAGEVLERTGGNIEALFNNGAYGQPGAVEDLSREVLRGQFEANVFGWHDLTCRLIPAMRRRRCGRIVNCSSVLGLVALKWRGAYTASKFAVEALSDTLRLELDGSGIHVALIEPGPIRSRFRSNATAMFKRHIDVEASPHAEEYRRQLAAEERKLAKGPAPLERPGRERRSLMPRYRLGPDAVLRALVHALEAPRPKARYRVTAPTQAMAVARRLLPTRGLDALAQRVS